MVKLPHFLNDRYTLLAILLLVISTAFILYSFWPTAGGFNIINVLEEYAKAILYLNKSTYSLVNMLRGYTEPPPLIGDVIDVKDKIKDYIDNKTVLYGDENVLVIRIASNYLTVSEATISILKAYEYLNSSLNSFRRSLQFVAVCDVDKALEEFSKSRNDISSTLAELTSSISLLKNVNRTYLAENHVVVVNTSLTTLSKIYESLYNAYKLLLLVERYKDVVKNMCRGETINDQNVLQMMMSELQNIRAVGPLSPEIMNARNQLISLISRVSLNTTSCNQGGNGAQNNTEGAQGSGAGYVPPESED